MNDMYRTITLKSRVKSVYGLYLEYKFDLFVWSWLYVQLCIK